MQPKVSVIIPTYNVQDYIGQAVQSALEQTVQDIEILITDDASTDNTVRAIKKIKDSKIYLTINKRNFGPSYSRNLALQRAKGEWIALLDGDDWWEKHRLERMLEVAESHQADLVSDDIQNYVEGEKNPWNETFLGRLDRSFNEYNPSAVDVIKYDLGPLKPLFRRDYLVQKGLCYKEEITYGEDFVLLLECLLHGAKMVIFSEPLYIRRAWEHSLTAQKQRSTECLIQLTETLLEKIRDKDYQDRLAGQYPEVIRALENRLKRQTNAYLYHQLTEPYKKGNALEAACQMLTLMLRQPRSIAVMAGKIPAIFDYRVLRRLKRLRD